METKTIPITLEIRIDNYDADLVAVVPQDTQKDADQGWMTNGVLLASVPMSTHRYQKKSELEVSHELLELFTSLFKIAQGLKS